MKASIILFLICLVSSPVLAQSATVTWGTTYQTIDGFGGGMGGLMSVMSSSHLNFFYTTAGIGLTILRVAVFPSNAQSPEMGCYGPDGCTSNTLAAASTDEITEAQQILAVNPSLKVLGSPFFSPSPMINPSTDFYIDNSTNNAQLAAIHTAWVSLMNSNGVPVYAISPQQEPDSINTSTPYSFTGWLPVNFEDYIPYLRSALNTANFSSTKILLPEPCCVAGDYTGVGSTISSWVDPILMSGSGSNVGLLANHAYEGGANFNPTSGTTTAILDNNYGLNYWMTEVSDDGPADDSITSGLTYAQSIHNYLVNANASAYLFWIIDCSGPDLQDHTNYNWCLTDIQGNIAKRAYVFGNWSEFVRPGWTRIDATANPVSGVYITAFKDPTNTQLTIVALNSNSSSQAITVSLSGAPTFSSVIPVLTSASSNLTPQSSVSLSSNSFTYTLPASSVTSFVGDTSTSSTSNMPAPPTQLTAKVQ